MRALLNTAGGKYMVIARMENSAEVPSKLELALA